MLEDRTGGVVNGGVHAREAVAGGVVDGPEGPWGRPGRARKGPQAGRREREGASDREKGSPKNDLPLKPGGSGLSRTG